MIKDPAEARLALIEALKEEFMDIVDDGTTSQQELVELNTQMMDMAVDIFDAFKMEVIGSQEGDVYDIRLQIPNYDAPQAPGS